MSSVLPAALVADKRNARPARERPEGTPWTQTSCRRGCAGHKPQSSRAEGPAHRRIQLVSIVDLRDQADGISRVEETRWAIGVWLYPPFPASRPFKSTMAHPDLHRSQRNRDAQSPISTLWRFPVHTLSDPFLSRQQPFPRCCVFRFYGATRSTACFKTVEKFLFADNRAFDFRGERQRTAKGFSPTRSFTPDYGGLAGRFKLDWIFVKTFIEGPRRIGQKLPVRSPFPGGNAGTERFHGRSHLGSSANDRRSAPVGTD
jgi:hypothetical protein